MRCLGRTDKFNRCKIETKKRHPFCRHHLWQPLVLLLITIPSIFGVYTSIYLDIIKPYITGYNNPIVEIEFSSPNSLLYSVRNESNEIAEKVLVSFGIMDIDGNLKDFVPLKSFEIDYINKKSSRGPWKVLDNYGINNHRYFGIIYLNCKGCDELKTYWLYIDQANEKNSFYCKRIKSDTYGVSFDSLIYFPTYLDRLVPIERRNKIKQLHY